MAKTTSKRIWDYLGAITKTKDVSVLNDPDFDKQYNSYVINMALSQHEDTVLSAAMMSERSHLPPNLQFLFLLNTLRARYRRSDWLKHTVSDDAKAVAEYYDCSLRHALGLVSLHTPEQLAVVHSRLEKGGMATGKGRRHESQSP